jgi:uncharacterized protein (TIRG00374 family)
LHHASDSHPAGRRWRIWLAALLVSVVLLAFLVSQADLGYLLSLWGSAQPVFLVIGVLVVIVDCWATGLRLRILHLGVTRRPRAVYMNIEVMHGLLLQLLPARLGELPYLVLLRRRLGMDHGEVFANFIYQRLLDTMVLALFFLSSLLLIVGDRESVSTWIPMVLVACTLFGLMFLGVEQVAAVVVRIMHRFHVRGSALSHWLLRVLSVARRWSRRLRLEGVRWMALVWTCTRWSAVMVLTWAAFAAFGIRLGVVETLFLGSGLCFATVIPLQTVGGFGVSEMGLAALLVVTGYPWQEATATALLVRVAYVVMMLAGLSAAALLSRLAAGRSRGAERETTDSGVAS